MRNFFALRVSRRMDRGTAPRRRRSFTLIELLVVIGILSILVGILLPVLSKSKGKGRVTKCVNRQSQLSIGIAMYAGDYEGFIPFQAGDCNSANHFIYKLALPCAPCCGPAEVGLGLLYPDYIGTEEIFYDVDANHFGQFNPVVGWANWELGDTVSSLLWRSLNNCGTSNLDALATEALILDYNVQYVPFSCPCLPARYNDHNQNVVITRGDGATIKVADPGYNGSWSGGFPTCVFIWADEKVR